MEQSDNYKLGELIFELANDNIYVLDDIYKMVDKLLYTIANIYYNQKADIEDIIHEFLMTLVDKAKRFKGNLNAYSWLTTCFKNLILNDLKHRKMVMRRQEEKSYEEFETILTEDEKYMENYVYLTQILDQLNKEELELVFYRFWLNLSLRDIASKLKISKTYVAKKIEQLSIKIEKMK